jgi:hypothetical protein
MLLDAHSDISEVENIGPINVDKASGPNGYRVAEIFAKKQDLRDRKVAVRGEVTKVNASIMGKTWIHIQDGTDDIQEKTNDPVVTFQDTPAVGDTVLIEGVVQIAKNYGMGYMCSLLFLKMPLSQSSRRSPGRISHKPLFCNIIES